MKPGDMRHSTLHRPLFGGPRICARCRQVMPSAGGRYVETRPGRQEWICGGHK